MLQLGAAGAGVLLLQRLRRCQLPSRNASAATYVPGRATVASLGRIGHCCTLSFGRLPRATTFPSA